ncbi:MAG: hypothetical protein QNJ22_10000 [Desulfosarcinaceae bacterium]|nr:hypothetical protein [Desulfosarcinaceae bacterium]
MDIITTAIIGALAKLSEDAIKDGYNALKTMLQRKFGSQSDVAIAVAELEQKPASVGRAVVLEEELQSVSALEDADLINVAEKLLERIADTNGPQTVVQQTVSGHHHIFSGSGNVSIHSRKE